MYWSKSGLFFISLRQGFATILLSHGPQQDYMDESNSTDRAVLFADITGSTRLFGKVGNVAARRLVENCLHQWTAIVESNDGKVVQLRGDGLLCTFLGPESAVHAAISIRDNQHTEPLSMHAGIHVGSFLLEGEQLYGDVVNIAAHVAEIAKSGEIIVTQETMQLLSADLQEQGRLLNKVPIKNSKPMNLYLIAERDPVTEYLPPDITRTIHMDLQLRYNNQTLLINDEKSEFLIGKVDDCDLIINHSLVSRHHAIIECKHGKYFLKDLSTNGTYVKDEGRATHFILQRELVQLKGKGIIALGMDPSNGLEHSIEFEEISSLR